jgi:hypothetical protein
MNQINYNAPLWVYTKPDKVTFKCIQKAIIAANKAKHPLEKKFAWKNVHELSQQYQRQEDDAKK